MWWKEVETPRGMESVRMPAQGGVDRWIIGDLDNCPPIGSYDPGYTEELKNFVVDFGKNSLLLNYFYRFFRKRDQSRRFRDGLLHGQRGRNNDNDRSADNNRSDKLLRSGQI
jgi:hypothetical protein